MKEDDDELQQRIERIATELIEHCDGLVILTTGPDHDNLHAVYRGSFHSMLGMMEHYKLAWMGSQAATEMQVRKNEEE